MSVQPAQRQESSTKSNQPVFVLHTYPFKETSLVVELFSREFGRIAAVAKGARRPRSAMRGMLQSFQPLLGAQARPSLKPCIVWNGAQVCCCCRVRL
jgi:recombinational DNA repair protein (RecF pathway)